MGDYFVTYGLLLVPVCLLGMRAFFGSRIGDASNSGRRWVADDNPLHLSSSHTARRASRNCFDDSTDSWTHDSGPSVNIDGTPMMGNVDIHGNPYGVTSYNFDDDSMFSDDSCSMFDDDSSSMFDDDSSAMFDDD